MNIFDELNRITQSQSRFNYLIDKETLEDYVSNKILSVYDKAYKDGYESAIRECILSIKNIKY